MSVINGNKLRVDVGYGVPYPLLCANSCSLTINQDTIDSSCKDSVQWETLTSGKKSWEITTDGLYVESELYRTSVVNLTDFIINSRKLAIGFKTYNDIGTSIINWHGYAYLTSISVNGDKDGAATYSATFKGIGELSQSMS